MKFRKKPVVIDAVQYTAGNAREILSFCGAAIDYGQTMIIPTLEGDRMVSLGDWIIKGVNGEFYLCKPDIFEKTYDSVE